MIKTKVVKALTITPHQNFRELLRITAKTELLALNFDKLQNDLTLTAAK